MSEEKEEAPICPLMGPAPPVPQNSSGKSATPS